MGSFTMVLSAVRAKMQRVDDDVRRLELLRCRLSWLALEVGDAGLQPAAGRAERAMWPIDR